MDQEQQEAPTFNSKSVDKKPGILIIGSTNVGKRTLISLSCRLFRIDSLARNSLPEKLDDDSEAHKARRSGQHVLSLASGIKCALSVPLITLRFKRAFDNTGLLSVNSEDAFESSSNILSYPWTINTKYYNADVSVWMAHLHEDFSIGALPAYDQLVALVMVFDVSDPSSFAALKDFVSHTDILKFEILLCIGNKVDLLPGHSAHVEYRRHLLKSADSSGIPYTELDSGISETEGSSLLGDDDSSLDVKRSYLDWCLEHNIEYVEACASNADFDKYFVILVAAKLWDIVASCLLHFTTNYGLSVDGDSQGAERLFGALSAYMWPGMILKSGDKITEPSLPEQQELSDEESDYELEYEILSAGSAEPWDDTDVGWVSADGPVATNGMEGSAPNGKSEIGLVRGEMQPSSSASELEGESDRKEMPRADATGDDSEDDKGITYDFENLEQLMSEIGNVRDSLRLMPDFQRREMAANLAMKMAAMFGDSSGDEGGFE
ncbi:putative RING-H2 finger protein ATL80-like [Capsicum annuum]|nr:putative RING-H2 finger protein ATL80-like [Capsicum annuum]